MERDRKHLQRIAGPAVTGAVKPPEIKLMKLSESVAAHRLFECGKPRGKIVFNIR